MVTRARICPSPGVSISSARTTAGSSPKVSGQLAHPAGAAVEADLAPEARLAAGVAGAGGRLGEHGAAGTVEVAGEHVEHVDQPRGERAELGGGGADAAVDARGGRGGELAGQPTDQLGVEAGGRGHDLGGERRRRLDDLVEAGDEVGAGAEVDEALAGDHLHHRHQQVGVGTGPDRHPLAGHLRRARAPRVDDHDRAAALDQPLEPAGPVGRGGERAVRRVRVGAEHEQVVGAVDVGHRHVEPAAEHQRRGDLLRALVDRGRREDVGGAEGPEDGPVVEHPGEVVGVRVADVHGRRVAAVLVEHREQPALDLGERLVPGHLHEARRRASPPAGAGDRGPRGAASGWSPWGRCSPG